MIHGIEQIVQQGTRGGFTIRTGDPDHLHFCRRKISLRSRHVSQSLSAVSNAHQRLYAFWLLCGIGFANNCHCTFFYSLVNELVSVCLYSPDGDEAIAGLNQAAIEAQFFYSNSGIALNFKYIRNGTEKFGECFHQFKYNITDGRPLTCVPGARLWRATLPIPLTRTRQPRFSSK